MSAPRLLPVATASEVRRHLRGLLARRRAALVLAFALRLTDSALTLAGPIAIGWITATVTSGRSTDALVGPLALLVGAMALGAATTWAAEVALARVVVPTITELREETLRAATLLPLDTVESAGLGDLVSRVSGDAEIVTDAATSTLGSFLTAAFTIASAFVGLAALDWRFALAGLVAVPIQAHTLRWYLRASGPVYAAARVADGRRASALLTGFTSLPTLRAFGLEGRQRGLIDQASHAAMEREFEATRAATRFYGRLNLAELLGLGAILLVGFLLVRHDAATIAEATTAALFFVGLFDPINLVLGVFDSIQEAGAGLARMVGVVGVVDVADEAGTEAMPPHAASAAAPGQVTATGLAFGYEDGPDVLHDLSFTLPGGSQLAVVGASGSGKSTLATLLAGVRAPRAGTVAAGARRIALVTQESHAFAGTVLDNLRLARPAATDAELRGALEAVGADWALRLPDGPATEIGSGAHLLTAVQAQQLALARVLVLDPAVVILDEATAEAGSESAGELDRSAAAVLAGRTSVVIAHRLSQVVDADLTLVMEAGRIVESGTHTELIAADGPYARLWSAWAARPDVGG